MRACLRSGDAEVSVAAAADSLRPGVLRRVRWKAKVQEVEERRDQCAFWPGPRAFVFLRVSIYTRVSIRVLCTRAFLHTPYNTRVSICTHESSPRGAPPPCAGQQLIPECRDFHLNRCNRPDCKSAGCALARSTRVCFSARFYIYARFYIRSPSFRGKFRVP